MVNLQSYSFISSNYPINNQSKMTKRSNPSLIKIFEDPKYAWDLLQCQIAIEMNESLSGQAIAKLLQLYMRGVQKMNSLVDMRQSYFKNKVTSLLMRGNVVKTLNKPPMAKKTQPLQVQTKTQEKTKTKAKQKGLKQKKVEFAIPKVQSAINSYSLQQKRRQIEMRVTYESQLANKDNISEIYAQHLQKQQHIQAKIVETFHNHQTKLQDRINKRKLKTATMRSRPENTNDTSTKQMDLIQVECHDNKEQIFSPRLLQAEAQIPIKKRHSSLQARAKQEAHLQNKRTRKYTFDFPGQIYQNAMTISITTLSDNKKSRSCKKIS